MIGIEHRGSNVSKYCYAAVRAAESLHTAIQGLKVDPISPGVVASVKGFCELAMSGVDGARSADPVKAIGALVAAREFLVYSEGGGYKDSQKTARLVLKGYAEFLDKYPHLSQLTDHDLAMAKKVEKFCAVMAQRAEGDRARTSHRSGCF